MKVQECYYWNGNSGMEVLVLPNRMKLSEWNIDFFIDMQVLWFEYANILKEKKNISTL